MRWFVLGSVMGWLLMGPGLGVSAAQSTGITARYDPWGRFQPGAWKVVRVVTETFDEEGTLSSTTQTKMTLESVGDKSITLLAEVCVEVGDKSIISRPQRVEQGFYGELAGQDVKETDGGTGEVTIEGRKIACKILELASEGPSGKTTTKIYYSDTVEPFILRRESVRTDLEGKNILSETTVSVEALNVSTEILQGSKQACRIRTVQKGANGTRTTLTKTSTAVPGGVVQYTSEEVDQTGRLVRRGSLELVDYGLVSEDTRPGLLRRRLFPNRYRRSYSYRTVPSRRQSSRKAD